MSNTAGDDPVAAVDPEALNACLERIAHRQTTVTYQQAAQALDLQPPNSIHRLVLALEACMTADAAAGRPLRAAVVVSRVGAGRPARGFFAHAHALGLYDGPETGEQARAFHHRELGRVHAAWLSP